MAHKGLETCIARPSTDHKNTRSRVVIAELFSYHVGMETQMRDGDFIYPKAPNSVSWRMVTNRVNLILAGTIALDTIETTKRFDGSKVVTTYMYGLVEQHIKNIPAGRSLWQFIRRYEIDAERRLFMNVRDIRRYYHRPIIKGKPLGVVPVESHIVGEWKPALLPALANPRIDPLVRYRGWSVL